MLLYDGFNTGGKQNCSCMSKKQMTNTCPTGKTHITLNQTEELTYQATLPLVLNKIKLHNK